MQARALNRHSYGETGATLASISWTLAFKSDHGHHRQHSKSLKLAIMVSSYLLATRKARAFARWAYCLTACGAVLGSI